MNGSERFRRVLNAETNHCYVLAWFVWIYVANILWCKNIGRLVVWKSRCFSVPWHWCTVRVSAHMYQVKSSVCVCVSLWIVTALFYLCYCPCLYIYICISLFLYIYIYIHICSIQIKVFGLLYYREISLGLGFIGKALWCCIPATAIIKGEVGQNTRSTLNRSEPFIWEGRPDKWTVLNRSFGKGCQKSDSSWTVPNRSEPFRKFTSFSCNMNRSEPYIWCTLSCFCVQNEPFWTVHLMYIKLFLRAKWTVLKCSLPGRTWNNICHMSSVITKTHV